MCVLRAHTSVCTWKTHMCTHEHTCMCTRSRHTHTHTRVLLSVLLAHMRRTCFTLVALDRLDARRDVEKTYASASVLTRTFAAPCGFCVLDGLLESLQQWQDARQTKRWWHPEHAHTLKLQMESANLSSTTDESRVQLMSLDWVLLAVHSASL